MIPWLKIITGRKSKLSIFGLIVSVTLIILIISIVLISITRDYSSGLSFLPTGFLGWYIFSISFCLSVILGLALQKIYNHKTIWQLRIMPVAKLRIWLVANSSRLLAAMISFCIMIGPAIILSVTEISMIILVGLCFAGSTAGFGYLVGIPKSWLAVIGLIAITVASRKFGRYILESNLTALTVLLVIIAFWITVLLTAIYGYTKFAPSYKNNCRYAFKFPLLSHNIWLITKLLRNQRIIIDLAVSVLASSVLVYLTYTGKLDVLGELQYFAIIPITSMLAIDIRSTIRNNKPSELYNLSNINILTFQEWLSTAIASTTTALPILIVSKLDLVGVIFWYSISVMCCTLALLVGNIFISNRTSGIEYSMIPLGFLGIDYIIYKLIKFFEDKLIFGYLVWISISILCYCAIIIIERRRHEKYGQS